MISKLTTPLLGICLLALAAPALHATQAVANSSTDSYAEYRNQEWHFSLMVPDDMTAVVHDLAGGGQTVMFSDTSHKKELQITAWPYTQLDLTLNREGEASGTHGQPDHLEIVDVVRVDVFTVLFVRNGVRYSVVTLPEQEAWLREILTTWQFI